jgi:hypothetical protein
MAMEVVIGYPRNHNESCPKCAKRYEDQGLDPEDVPVMERLSPCCYRCPDEACQCLVLAGWDRYKMSKRVALT